MAKIIAETTFGGQAGNEKNGGVAKSGFKIVLTADMEFAPDTLAELLEEAFVSLLYRGGASHILPLFGKGVNASDVEYSDAKAGEIVTTLEAWFKASCPNKRGVAAMKESYVVTLEVTEYTPGEGTTPKYAKVKSFIEDYLAVAPTRTVEVFAEKRGLPVPQTTPAVAADGELAAVAARTWKNDDVFLAAANTWLVAEMKKAAAAE